MFIYIYISIDVYILPLLSASKTDDNPCGMETWNPRSLIASLGLAVAVGFSA